MPSLYPIYPENNEIILNVPSIFYRMFYIFFPFFLTSSPSCFKFNVCLSVNNIFPFICCSNIYQPELTSTFRYRNFSMSSRWNHCLYFHKVFVELLMSSKQHIGRFCKKVPNFEIAPTYSLGNLLFLSQFRQNVQYNNDKIHVQTTHLSYLKCDKIF